MGHLIPIQPVHETEALIAFYHPKPSYPLHILIIPKRPISGLEDIQAEDQDFLSDLFECVAVLVRKQGLDARGYRLIANGGRYQEVPLLHFHLISEDAGSLPLKLDQSP